MRMMFHKFSDEEASRLNRGVRGRLVEHCKYLVRESKIKGYDASIIFENTKELPYDALAEERYHDPTVDLTDMKGEPSGEKIEDTTNAQ